MQYPPHPTDLALSRLLDGELEPREAARVKAHVEQCAICQAHAGPGEPTTIEAPSQDELQALVRAGPAIPAQTIQALQTDRRTERTPGQLWRLEWGGHTILALLIRYLSTSQEWLVVPVTTDPEWGDQYTLTVGEDPSPLGVELAIWVALRANVPEQSLDQPLGTLNGELLKVIKAAHEAFMRDEWVPSRYLTGEIGVGSPITDPVDERWEYRERVADTLTEISERCAAELTEPGEDADLSAVLDEHDLGPEELADTLGLSEEETFDLITGSRTPTQGQARTISETLGVPVERLGSLAPRDAAAILRTLAGPEIRSLFQQKALDQGQSVAGLRQAFLEDNLALAARRTGEAPEHRDGWEQIIRDWLNSSR